MIDHLAVRLDDLHRDKAEAAVEGVVSERRRARLAPPLLRHHLTIFFGDGHEGAVRFVVRADMLRDQHGLGVGILLRVDGFGRFEHHLRVEQRSRREFWRLLCAKEVGEDNQDDEEMEEKTFHRPETCYTSQHALASNLRKLFSPLHQGGNCHKRLVEAVRLERESVPSFDRYPFCLPAVRHLKRLEFDPARSPRIF